MVVVYCVDVVFDGVDDGIKVVGFVICFDEDDWVGNCMDWVL